MKLKQILKLEKELHSHDSIPCYTGEEKEGCITCIKNQSQDLLGERELCLDKDALIIFIREANHLPQHDFEECNCSICESENPTIEKLVAILQSNFGSIVREKVI